MAGRNTKATSFKSSSSYHEKCISASVKAYQESFNAAPSEQTYSTMEYRNCNQVAQNKIWIENVNKEYSAAKRWKTNWGFMATTERCDYKGRSLEKKADGKPKETKYITPYNGSIPVTTSKQYGHRLGTPQSCKMSQLERLTCYHKKKSGIADNYT